MSFTIGTTATKARDEICAVGRSVFDRGLTSGSTGNISVRLGDGSLILTPTNASLGELDPATLAHVSADGKPLSGDKPTKEAFLHQCMYCKRPHATAVVHLHCIYAVAVSILADVDKNDVLPPLTSYYVMRVGKLPLVPYFPPGDPELAAAVKAVANENAAVLLANHGPVVAGETLRSAQYALEELEETAKLFLLVGDRAVRALSASEAANLRAAYPIR